MTLVRELKKIESYYSRRQKGYEIKKKKTERGKRGRKAYNFEKNDLGWEVLEIEIRTQYGHVCSINTSLADTVWENHYCN